MAGMQSFHLLPAALAANIVFAPSLRCRCIAWLPKRQAASPSHAVGQARPFFTGHAFDGNGLISLRCTKLRQLRRRTLKRCLGRAVLVLRRRCGVSDFEIISGQENNRLSWPCQRWCEPRPPGFQLRSPGTKNLDTHLFRSITYPVLMSALFGVVDSGANPVSKVAGCLMQSPRHEGSSA